MLTATCCVALLKATSHFRRLSGAPDTIYRVLGRRAAVPTSTSSPRPQHPEQFAAQIKKDALKRGDVVKRAGIKPD
jgi:hypothetical protein